MFYVELLARGKLLSYFVDVEKQAQELFDCMMKQWTKRGSITEKLKAEN